eukprot:gene17841-19622_t
MNNNAKSTCCEVCSKEPNFRCSSCQIVYYCSKAHQVQDWQRHRRKCNLPQRLQNTNLSDSPQQNSSSSDISPSSSSQSSSKLLQEFVPITNPNCISLPELSDKILVDLSCRNFAVVDNLFEDSLISEVYSEVKFLYENSSVFHRGQLSRNSLDQECSREIRNDFVTWIDNATYPNMTHLLSAISYVDRIVATMGRSSLLADYNMRSRSSIMVACYPGKGAHYKRHVDNPSKDGRILTVIMYLNRNYNAGTDGGVLRIFSPDIKYYYDVFPIFGRIVMFWSDPRVPHEVLPAFRERFAASVWYFDTKERIEALQSNKMASSEM